MGNLEHRLHYVKVLHSMLPEAREPRLEWHFLFDAGEGTVYDISRLMKERRADYLDFDIPSAHPYWQHSIQEYVRDRCIPHEWEDAEVQSAPAWAFGLLWRCVRGADYDVPKPPAPATLSSESQRLEP